MMHRPRVTGPDRCGSCNGYGTNRNAVTRLRHTCAACKGSGRDPRAPPKDQPKKDERK